MSNHHTELIVDVCEKLEPWFRTLTDKEKQQLTEDKHVNETASAIFKRAVRYDLIDIIHQLDGSKCRQSLIRDAIRQLVREHDKTTVSHTSVQVYA